MNFSSEENDMVLLGITEDFLEKNADTISTADWMFAQFVKLANCAAWLDKGLPKKEDIMKAIVAFKRNPLNAEQAKAPAWHDEYVKLSVMWFARLLVSPTPEAIANAKEALFTSAAAEGLGGPEEVVRRLPFLHELLHSRDYNAFVQAHDVEDIKSFEENAKFMGAFPLLCFPRRIFCSLCPLQLSTFRGIIPWGYTPQCSE
jgi:hypothetical protein